ncbi:MAG: hypothetical protein AAB592_02370, partial [Patescibacteria group bacterium]
MKNLLTFHELLRLASSVSRQRSVLNLNFSATCIFQILLLYYISLKQEYMLPKIPKTLLVAGLALPLTVTLPSIKAVESTRSAISIGVSDAIAAPLEAATEEIEYVQDGRQRILRAKGKDLNALHSTASREFLRRLEEEIKKPDARLTIANFETSIRFENGEFIFEYRARLNPASSQNEVHTLISMRGTVWCGRD